MVQFLSIFFFLGFLQFLLGFSKVPVFLCHPVLLDLFIKSVLRKKLGTAFACSTVKIKIPRSDQNIINIR